MSSIENDVREFARDFDIVNNALDMRTLVRWNGRNLRNKENLSEHTHLVVACAIELIDYFSRYGLKNFDFENIIRRCMTHDSLELLRGDILSITKDKIPGLREKCDEEEKFFLDVVNGKQLNDIELKIVLLSDLMACYKFIERELQFPSNDFSLQVYKDTKNKFDKELDMFTKKYVPEIIYLKRDVELTNELYNKFVKGYANDAAYDIVLDKDVTLMPMSTETFDFSVKYTPKKGTFATVVSRSSAAKKGIITAMCPIDADYNGTIQAIVHNISNNIITYKRGESFAQMLILPVKEDKNIKAGIKKSGKRTDGKMGSTDVSNS